MATMTATTDVRLWSSAVPPQRQRLWREYTDAAGSHGFHSDPRWLAVLRDGLRHRPYAIEATRDGRVAGVLPLALVKSLLFGRFLVSLPYVNSAGVVADDDRVAVALIDRAVELADELDVRHLEFRHERKHEHAALTGELTGKVHMRLTLPSTPDELWKRFKPKVRNQVRKGEKQGLTVEFGTDGLLEDFYAVFSRNMRDLGTPVFGRRLFRSMLAEFPDRAEFCVVRTDKLPIAAGLLVHGNGITEVPSASSLRKYNPTNANMLMYWHLLVRTIERGQEVFDFGRSSVDSNTFRFKQQWGAEPVPATWQYYVRKGNFEDMRRESGKFTSLSSLWCRMPLGLSRLIGPIIVRGIP